MSYDLERNNLLQSAQMSKIYGGVNKPTDVEKGQINYSSESEGFFSKCCTPWNIASIAGTSIIMLILFIMIIAYK